VIIYALIISLMLFLKKYKKDALFFSGAMILGGAFIYMAKEIVKKARPENALAIETSPSFPSGHALISLIFFGFLIFIVLNSLKSKAYKPIISIALIVLILLIGISRLILNVHFFSDVLGGWLLGLFILFASISIKQQ
jgi:undecaprenyl-diphosphatase